jgi:hypothetical protein
MLMRDEAPRAAPPKDTCTGHGGELQERSAIRWR